MVALAKSKSLVAKFSNKYSVDPVKMMETLKSTVFNSKDGISDEQMMSLLIVADQYNLNPFTREIYPFPSNNGIVPVVGVDGWSRIINSHKDFDGMEFNYSEEMVTPEGAKTSAHKWVECVIYRKDRSRPITVREYLDEVYRPPFKGRNGDVIGPWQTHTKRFHRHKAMIQASRIAFGFSGIYDQDEADRISEQESRDQVIDGQFEEAKQLPPYPNEKFNASFAAQSKLIANGSKTAEDIIKAISTRYTLTQEQMDAYIGFELDVKAEREENK